MVTQLCGRGQVPGEVLCLRPPFFLAVGRIVLDDMKLLLPVAQTFE